VLMTKCSLRFSPGKMENNFKDREKLIMRKICYNDVSRLAPAMPVFEDVDSSPSKCEFAGCVVDVLGIGWCIVWSLYVVELYSETRTEYSEMGNYSRKVFTGG
jgi:hypothetical protein